MTNQTNKQILSKQAEAKELHDRLVITINLSRKGFIVIGKLLHQLREEDLFKQAEGVEEWIEYIKQPEIGLTYGEANRFIQIYEQFCLRFGFDEDYISDIPLKNLHYLLPMVKNMKDGSSVDELLDNALHLSQKDFKEVVFDIKNQEEDTRTYTFMVMKKCDQTSNMTKIHDIPSEVIENFVNEHLRQTNN